MLADNHPLTPMSTVPTGGAAFTVNAVDPPPDWNERYFYKWGYARVTAINATYLSWDWVESSSGTVWDRMAIQVQPPPLHRLDEQHPLND